MADSLVPMMDLKRGYEEIKDQIDRAIKEVLESQQFIMGPEVKAFESDVERYLEVKNARGCASGSDALLLSLMALGVKPGDQVITTAYSFFATASCIARLGAVPVFADVDFKTYNVTPETVFQKITDKTKAFIPVHLFGQMAALEDLVPHMESRGIPVVEDCAQAFGSFRSLKSGLVRPGTMGSMGCFSFFPTKNLGGFGDGGMVVTKDDVLADRISKLRLHGASDTYHHDEIGLNSRLDSLQAAVLRVKLRHLEKYNEKRRLAADRYRALFAEKDLLDFVTPPVESPLNFHIYHQYVVTVEGDRDGLMKFMESRSVSSRVYYPVPLHLQKCFSYLGCREGDCPNAEKLSRQSVALPIFPEITEKEQERVVESMEKFYRP